MSSSGLIYAFIVGAWAVYLVPMWLRREDELNTARQTQRYTTAIKVLSHKDSFERRFGAAAVGSEAQTEGQERELPVAVGQSGPASAAGTRTLDRVKAKDRERQQAQRPEQVQRRESAAPASARPASQRAASAGASSFSASGRTAASSSAASSSTAGKAAPRVKAAFAAEPAASSTRRVTVSAKVGPADAVRETEAADPRVWTPPPAPAPSARSAALGPNSLLRARRRRVVGFLFALTSLGAIVSADLGLSYVWVMLLPAVALSAYIVWVRKDERARAAERARRRAAAVKSARESERREVEMQREQEEATRLEREELARRNAVARRRTAAARSRAERRTTPGLPDQGDLPDLPRAANG
jgi:hypothetical protein